MDCRWGYLARQYHNQQQVRHGPQVGLKQPPLHHATMNCGGMVGHGGSGGGVPGPLHSCAHQAAAAGRHNSGHHGVHHVARHHGHHSGHHHRHAMGHGNTTPGAIRFRELRRAHSNRANSYGIYRRQGYNRGRSKMVSIVIVVIDNMIKSFLL